MIYTYSKQMGPVFECIPCGVTIVGCCLLQLPRPLGRGKTDGKYTPARGF
jgi:hypothetical protein